MTTAEAERRVVARAAVIVGVGGVAFGLDLGAVSGALEGARTALDLSPAEVAVAVAVFAPGECLGGLLGGVLGDRAGRRAAIGAAALLLIASSVFLAGAASSSWLVLGRFISGAAAGLSLVAQIAWASDVAPPARVGSLVACYELAIAAGYLATFSVYALGGAGWRGLFLLPAAPALAQLLLLPGTPESARWLRAARGPAAAEAAHAELYRRWGKTDAPPPPPASEPEATWTDAWAWRVPYLAFVVQSFLTFSTGGFTLQVFAVPVLRAAGCSPRAVRTVMILLGSAKLVATAVILVGIDRWNRVPVLEKSLLATAACGAALAFASGPVVAIAIMILWRAVFQFGFGSLNFVLLGELFPAGVKGRLVALEIIPSSAWNFASSYMFSRALDAGFLAPLLIAQACVAVLGALVVRLFAVETRGRTPHEIRAVLRGAAAKEDAVAAPEVEMRERKPSDEKRPGAMLLEADGDRAAVT